jgi:flagella basal body P-ring formation protein FlgA
MTLFRRLLLPAVLCATPVVAAPFEDLDRLEVQVVAALGAGIGEPGGPARPIDRRLRLAACATPPVVTMPYKTAAAVHCESVGWRIHVPLVRLEAANVREAKPEPVVRKGDQVEVVADGGNFVVSTVAVAQQDGAPGDRIRLRTDAKATPFFGRVSAQGRVVISGFK